MSFTETQVIHAAISQSQSPSLCSTTAFLLSNSEMGVIKQSEHPTKTGAGGLRDPTYPQSCKLSFLSAWLLNALSYFQKAHVAFTAFLIKTNEVIARRFLALLPLLLYLSLLVLVLQGAFVVGLLIQTLPPSGLSFQLTCIAMMGVVFCYTTPPTDYYQRPPKSE